MTKVLLENHIEPQKKSSKPLDVFIQMKRDNRWKIFGQAALITLSNIFIFGAIGWMLDKWIWGKGHSLFITFIILSYPVAQFTLYQRIKIFKPIKK